MWLKDWWRQFRGLTIEIEILVDTGEWKTIKAMKVLPGDRMVIRDGVVDGKEGRIVEVINVK